MFVQGGAGWTMGGSRLIGSWWWETRLGHVHGFTLPSGCYVYTRGDIEYLSLHAVRGRAGPSLFPHRPSCSTPQTWSCW